MGIQANRKVKWLAAGLALASATAAYAWEQDVNSGGALHYSSSSNTLTLSATGSGGRAEIRAEQANRVTDGRVRISGRFMLTRLDSGSKVSVMQFLNQKQASASGGSEPITQLVVEYYDTIRRNGRNIRRYRFYVPQAESGDKYCMDGSNYLVRELNQNVNITGHVDRGSSPVYNIDGTICQKPNRDGDRGGRVYDGGQLVSGRIYYPKMGLYHQSSSSGTANGRYDRLNFAY